MPELTADERAARVVGVFGENVSAHDWKRRLLIPKVAQAIRDAEATQRERDAKIAEDYDGSGMGHHYYAQLGDAAETQRDIADAIRRAGEGE